MRSLRHGTALCALAFLVSACSTLGLSRGGLSGDEKKLDASKEKREALTSGAPELQVNAGVDKDWIKLPDSVKNPSWPLAGGNAQNVPGHPALSATVRLAWRAGIGDGSGGDLRLLARPLIAEDKVFAMDASGHVTALNLRDGEKFWRVSTQAEDSEDNEAMGGGIAYDGGRIFATTGHGDVVALSAQDGRALWRRKLPHPLRVAPVVAEGRVFAVTLGNATFALNAADGAVLWTQNGMAQMAALLGGASPAVAGDVVLTAYSSGEIFALRAQNGRVAWGDVLVAPQSGSMPEMADISASPVIDRGGAFALNRGGRMAALVMRSGEHAWDADIGGRCSPLVAGNVVYVLTDSQNLVALRRDNGKLIWQRQLQSLSDPEDRESSPVVWTGPVLAGGRLFLVNSREQLAEFGALDGKPLTTHELPDASFIAPVAAQGTLLTVTEDGDVVAFR